MVALGTKEVRTLDDGWTVETKDRRASAHFEHTVAMTPDGPRVLTYPGRLTGRGGSKIGGAGIAAGRAGSLRLSGFGPGRGGRSGRERRPGTERKRAPVR